MNSSKIKALEEEIIKHKSLYYRGKAQISDQEYDDLEQKLKKLDPENPILQAVGAKVNGNNKVSHDKKMLSLEKTYDIESLIKWIGEEEILALFKIDGTSCSLLYEKGHLVMAKTRGDGKVGENITDKAYFIKSIPKTISIMSKTEVRGEIYCTNEGFVSLTHKMSELGLEKPSSQRNIVAGLIGRKENIYLAEELEFKGFDLLNDELKLSTEEEKLLTLQKNAFVLPPFLVTKKISEVKNFCERTKSFIEDGEYLIDGMVVVYNKVSLHEELGETSHHPRYKMAFKFQGVSAMTTIESIEWNVSRNGVLTPVSLVRPVELSGAQIRRVTLHNYGVVRDHELKSGDEIEIVRSGEVIPKFISVSKRSTGEVAFPQKCPSCGEPLEIQDIWLKCINDSCPDKILQEIVFFAKKIGIDDISEKRLLEMIKIRLVSTIPDLYKLSVDDFLKLDKVKEKLSQKMYQNIQKTKSVSLVTFLTALGIEGIASNKWEKIMSAGFNSLDKVLGLKLEQLIEIDGFAEKSAKDILNSLLSKRKLIKELLAIGFKIENDQTFSEGKLSGEKVCITGQLSRKRSDIEKDLKSNGAVVVGSVSKNTTILLTNETDSTSSKFKKAKELGTRVMSEEEVYQLIG